MTKVMRQAYAEVDEVLKYLPKSYVEKVPIKFRKLFSECKLQDYDVKIYPDKSLEAQKFVRETVILLAILKYNFWCESDEEKKRVGEIFKENSRKATEKYDISKLNKKIETLIQENNFIDTIDSKMVNDDLLPVKVEKTSWFAKILDKLKNIFKK
jgi:hypothetical protein